MKLSVRHALYLVIALLVLVTAVLSMSYFSLSELMYPVRRDSLFMRSMQIEYEQKVRAGEAAPGQLFLFRPEELALDAEPVFVLSDDSVQMTGWFVRDTGEARPVVLMIPDIRESRIDYLTAASELWARGLACCLADMRMMGSSQGECYAWGRQAAADVLQFVEALSGLPYTGDIILMGNGTGAVAALESARDTAVDVVVAQNPFLDLDRYIHDYAAGKYGAAGELFLPLMKRKFEKQTSVEPEAVSGKEAVRRLRDPALFISLLSEERLDFRSTGVLYEACASVNKEWVVFRKDHISQDAAERKKYYDRIAAFIHMHLPKEKRIPGRRKPLVEAN